MDLGKKVFNLSKGIGDIIGFCKKYQDDYPWYSKTYNNCRKFMTLLCVFLGIENSDNLAAEDLAYAAMATTNLDLSAVDLAKHAVRKR